MRHDAGLYRAIKNNPINNIDPTGLFTVKPTDYLPALSRSTPFDRGRVDVLAIDPSLTNFNLGTRQPAARGATVRDIQPAASLPSRDQLGVSTGDDGFVRRVAGQTVVPTAPERLPLRLQQALNDPSRYMVTSHQGVGYNVVDLQSGTVQFVNTPEVLPLVTRQRQARNEGGAAAQRATALTLAQEALITISPVHETARDIGVASAGYDYAEPNRTFTAEDRLGSTFLLFAPGGNSGQLRLADNFVEEVLRRGNNKQISRLREFRVQTKLEGRFGAENVLSERLLRNAQGNIVLDPVTGTGRRLDFVVVDQSGNVRYLPEVTSRNQKLTGGKLEQLRKEQRIREVGGVFVRDPRTGNLINVSNVQTRIIGVEPKQ